MAMSEQWIILMLLCIPIIGALLLSIIDNKQQKWIRKIAIASSLLPFACVILLFRHVNIEDVTVELNGLSFKLPSLYDNDLTMTSMFHLRADSLGVIFLMIVSLILFACTIAGVYIKKRQKMYYICALLLLFAVYGIILSSDMIMYVGFFFMTILLLYFLVTIWAKKDGEKWTIQLFSIQWLGWLCVLITVMIMIASYGWIESNGLYMLTSEYEVILHNIQSGFSVNENMHQISFIVWLIGFALVTPIIGLHKHLITLFREGHHVVSGLYFGMMLNIAAYSMYRLGIGLYPQQMQQVGSIIIWIVALQILFAAFMIWKQNDFASLIAYAIWGMSGLVWIGIFNMKDYGLHSSIYHSASLSIIAVLLLLICASLWERFGSLQNNDLKGIATSMPFLASMLLAGIFSLIGVPGFSGFISLFMTSVSIFETNVVIIIIFGLSIIFMLIKILKTSISMLYGSAKEQMLTKHDTRFIEAMPMIILVSFIILMGCYPAVFIDNIDFSIQSMLDFVYSTDSTTTDARTPWNIDQGKTDLMFIITIGALLMMTLSVLMAIGQSNIMRWLYWQCWVHGILLIVFTSYVLFVQLEGMLINILLMLISFVVTIIGLTFVMKQLTQGTDGHIERLSGLYFRKPATAFILLLLMMALVAVPFTTGFMVRLWLLSYLTELKMVIAVILIGFVCLLSWISCLRIIYQIYVSSDSYYKYVDSNDSTKDYTMGNFHKWKGIMIPTVCLIVVCIMGILPSLL